MCTASHFCLVLQSQWTTLLESGAVSANENTFSCGRVVELADTYPVAKAISGKGVMPVPVRVRLRSQEMLASHHIPSPPSSSKSMYVPRWYRHNALGENTQPGYIMR